MPKASNSKLVSELVKIFLLNEEELIKLHKVGKKLPKKKPHQSRYCGTKEFDKISKGLEARITGLRISEDKLYSLRQFAEQFTQKDVKELLAIKKTEKTKGMKETPKKKETKKKNLTWSYILYSLSLTPHAKRLKLLKDCLKKGLTCQQFLEQKLKATKEDIRPVGRKPTTAMAMLKRIADMADQYTLTSRNGLSDVQTLLSQYKKMPCKIADVEREIQRAQISLEKLQRQTKEVLGMLKAKK